MKVWIMFCLNWGSMLNIFQILLDFLHFAKDFGFWTIYLKSHKKEWDSTKNNVLFVSKSLKNVVLYWNFRLVEIDILPYNEQYLVELM